MGTKSLKYMKRIGGARRKTRHLFTKHKNEKGKVSLRNYFQSFKLGDRVRLSLDSSIHTGMYHAGFYGKSGTIGRMQGKCYEVMIKDGGKEKCLIVHPVHLKKG
ncbi:MAG: 50S ribosomal protein L21e [Nanoarchaeota archaeon]|nr:50S ribosomal protein L21e [Nanoarchaeota archaeon]MBU1005483.1 50S ribosomal protein L21e [Nanoarchaeota archaeon]MBU1947053.1 50S ribosomal protein L21e [Nanoarchaeota archaeon]